MIMMISKLYLIPGLVDDVVLYHMIKNLSFIELINLWNINKKWQQLMPLLIKNIDYDDVKLLNNKKLKKNKNLTSLNLYKNKIITNKWIK